MPRLRWSSLAAASARRPLCACPNADRRERVWTRVEHRARVGRVICFPTAAPLCLPRCACMSAKRELRDHAKTNVDHHRRAPRRGIDEAPVLADNRRRASWGTGAESIELRFDPKRSANARLGIGDPTHKHDRSDHKSAHARTALQIPCPTLFWAIEPHARGICRLSCQCELRFPSWVRALWLTAR